MKKILSLLIWTLLSTAAHALSDAELMGKIRFKRLFEGGCDSMAKYMAKPIEKISTDYLKELVAAKEKSSEFDLVLKKYRRISEEIAEEVYVDMIKSKNKEIDNVKGIRDPLDKELEIQAIEFWYLGADIARKVAISQLITNIGKKADTYEVIVQEKCKNMGRADGKNQN
jgi:hypothetical protein